MEEFYIRIHLQIDRYWGTFDRAGDFPTRRGVEVRADIERKTSPLDAPEEEVPLKRDDTGADTTEAVVKICQLEEWDRTGNDRRKGQLIDYIRYIHANGPLYRDTAEFIPFRELTGERADLEGNTAPN